MNVTEYYKENKTNGKKSPGAWLQLKDTKALLDDQGIEAPKKQEEGWIFDDVLTDLYVGYLLLENEESLTEDKTDMQKETLDWRDAVKKEYDEKLNSEITEYIENRFFEKALGLNKTKLFGMGVKDLWKDASLNLKTAYCSIMCSAIMFFTQYNKKVDIHLMNEFLSIESSKFSDRSLFLTDGYFFKNDEHEIGYNIRNTIVSKKVA
jgi:hypothetical protein